MAEPLVPQQRNSLDDILNKAFDDLERENKELRKHQLELVMENGELKDMVLDLGGDYTENKGE